ncbi:MAG TPA: hypothetical protein ENK26_04055 [Gammaproteobacteria bacterium]|nr:hypothetical protein [Gammaproteobacteria bacterium]
MASRARSKILTTVVCLSAGSAALAGGDVPTEFTNQGGIKNTRHNLTQNVPGINSSLMDLQRNNYGEICVYCHTPHGANTTPGMPLWNRQTPTGPYTTYDQLNTTTLTQTVTSPGANSLTCLSCHDGSLAIDAIMNMPGPGRYSANPDISFLNQWANPGGSTSSHAHMGDPTGANPSTGCMVCHNDGGSGNSFPDATDFSVFLIGTDLRNDHPVGVSFPSSGAAAGFNTPTPVSSSLAVFDTNGNNRANTNEIRVYDTGEGFEVECASCHDPHGVPSAGPGSTHYPTFLRVDNSNGSAVCLTCHIK